MDFDRYFGLSTSSNDCHSTIKSQFDVCIDFEEDDEEVKGEYFCPFCSEDFDFIGLCCHIEEDHRSEVNSGVCPICLLNEGMNTVGHIASHHGNISNKSWHKLKHNKGESHSTLLTLTKELQNVHFQSLLSRSSSSVSSRIALDPLLSFVYITPTADVSESVHADSSIGENAEEKTSYKKTLDINVIQSALSDKDHVERAKRCEFVQGLMLSTIFNDDL